MKSLRLVIAAALIALGAVFYHSAPVASQQGTAADTAAVLSNVARDVEARGDAAFAEALLRHIVARYPGTPAAAVAQRRLEARLAAGPSDRSGAIELHVWSTLYGLWLGAAVPGALGADDPEPYGVGLLVGGPAGYLTARSLLRDRPISVGQARAITWGGTWGSWQGFGWGEVLDLNSETTRYAQEICVEIDPLTGRCLRMENVTYESEEQDEQKVFASLIAGGVLGIAAGSIIASRGEISPGTATLVNFGSLWGSWYGLAASMIANQDEGENDDDRVLLWTLIGGNTGLISTALFVPKHDVSRARARIINVAGVVGLLGGFGIDLLVQPEDDAVLFGIPMVTSAAGLALGASMTRDYDRVARVGGDAGAIGGSALLRIREGRVDLGMPAPIPTFVRTARAAGRRAPALKFTLLDARF